MEHILSLSYGKDSLACLGAIEKLGWPLDRIVHAEVWATDTIPADLPPMVEFKAKADKIINERWGIEVEHTRAKRTYEERFYTVRTEKAKKRPGMIYGWPFSITGAWCNSDVKMPPLKAVERDGNIVYIGIAADEPNRFHNLTNIKKSPLVKVGWTESDCLRWCDENDLLSPIYTTATRGGCWFCHNQRVDQLRLLRKNYPDYWKLMLKWDSDSPVTFKPDGHTVHDYDRRFALEDMGLVPMTGTFRWSMVSDYDQWPIMPEVLRLRASGGAINGTVSKKGDHIFIPFGMFGMSLGYKGPYIYKSLETAMKNYGKDADEIVEYAPIVRCTDCKHFIPSEGEPEGWDGFCIYNEIEVDTGDFCSVGRKRVMGNDDGS